MAFHLEVEFTGLCLYAPTRHGNNVTSVRVYLPDCRRGAVNSVHSDAQKGEPHVGYLRANLANIVGAAVNAGHVGNSLDGPRFEVVYQFNRQQLEFVIDDDNPGQINYEPLGVPNFQTILGAFNPLPGLDSNDPPKPLLFRTTLRGGTIRGRRGNGNWRIPNSVGNANYGGQFSEVITWKCDVEDSLVLKLTNFDGATNPQLINLTAEEGETVYLKIANLCSLNPLEWSALTIHVERQQDRDFKWLYRLLQGQNPLRVPELAPGFQAFGVEDCLGGGDE